MFWNCVIFIQFKLNKLGLNFHFFKIKNGCDDGKMLVNFIIKGNLYYYHYSASYMVSNSHDSTIFTSENLYFLQ